MAHIEVRVEASGLTPDGVDRSVVSDIVIPVAASIRRDGGPEAAAEMLRRVLIGTVGLLSVHLTAEALQELLALALTAAKQAEEQIAASKGVH